MISGPSPTPAPLAQTWAPWVHSRGETLLNAFALQGGIAMQATVLEVRRADGREHRYVVRRLARPKDSQAAARSYEARMRREFAVLDFLRDQPTPAPFPVAIDTSGQFLDDFFLVLNYIEGQTHTTPPVSDARLQQYVQTLVEIHGLQASPPRIAELPSPLDWLARKLAKPLDRPLENDLGEDRVRAELERRISTQSVHAPTFLHGDYWPGNVLWRTVDGVPKLVGVIDWEEAAYGDPLSDLAIARLDFLWAYGSETCDRWTAAYFDAAPDVDPAQLPFWDLFAALRPMGHLSEWAGDAHKAAHWRVQLGEFIESALGALPA